MRNRDRLSASAHPRAQQIQTHCATQGWTVRQATKSIRMAILMRRPSSRRNLLRANLVILAGNRWRLYPCWTLWIWTTIASSIWRNVICVRRAVVSRKLSNGIACGLLIFWFHRLARHILHLYSGSWIFLWQIFFNQRFENFLRICKKAHLHLSSPKFV